MLLNYAQNMDQLDARKMFSERLKLIRERQGLSQVELAVFLGVSSGAVGNWEACANLPPKNKLSKIASKLSVSVDYLLGREESIGEPMVLSELPLPYGAKRVALEREKIKLIPVVSWARAGVATDYAELAGQIDEWVESKCSDPDAFALIIEGDSMEPEFRAGDRVVFAPNSEPRNGDYVVARQAEDGGVLFKKFRRTGPEGKIIRLESINPNYKTLEFAVESFRFIYPAVDLKRLFPR